MIIERFFDAMRARPRNSAVDSFPEAIGYGADLSVSGKMVTPETSRTIATAYRCGNIISDDVAKMPFQVFIKRGQQVEKLQPNAFIRNMAYMLEIQPNRYWTPFLFKKTAMQWLLYWGNCYIWQPPGRMRELYILPASSTCVVFDARGNRYFETTWASGETSVLPDVEVMHLMINSEDGYEGESIISYARETIGRQLGAHEVQSKFYKQGMTAAGIIYAAGDLNKQAREKIRESYTEAVSGSGNVGKVAIFDSKITKFEPVSIKPNDAQFLESIQATDLDIANFFGLPLYKLNSGKQTYQSNEQQNLDYLSTTLDPYLVQWEQGAALKWLSMEEQSYTYFRFNRDSILRTDASTRAAYLEKKIFSGQLTPNEARQIDDLSSYPGGDRHYVPSNMTAID